MDYGFDGSNSYPLTAEKSWGEDIVWRILNIGASGEIPRMLADSRGWALELMSLVGGDGFSEAQHLFNILKADGRLTQLMNSYLKKDCISFDKYKDLVAQGKLSKGLSYKQTNALLMRDVSSWINLLWGAVEENAVQIIRKMFRISEDDPYKYKVSGETVERQQEILKLVAAEHIVQKVKKLKGNGFGYFVRLLSTPEYVYNTKYKAVNCNFDYWGESDGQYRGGKISDLLGEIVYRTTQILKMSNNSEVDSIGLKLIDMFKFNGQLVNLINSQILRKGFGHFKSNFKKMIDFPECFPASFDKEFVEAFFALTKFEALNVFGQELIAMEIGKTGPYRGWDYRLFKWLGCDDDVILGNKKQRNYYYDY